MTNNLSTIEGAQQEVIDQFEANLHAKGVLDAQFDPSTGLLGLINRIPDIEPSVNINLDISLTLSSSETSINYGESILLTATLLASYEGVGDVDLKTGEITGATITFKKGQTIIGTSITDNNGVATLTYTPVAADCDTTLDMSAVFSGTDNFNSANSTNINVTVNSKIELTSNKNILSYADEQKNPGSQVATLTATLYSSTPTGQTIQLYDASDDSVIGNMTDNNDGTYTYSYTSQGSGDIGFYAKLGNLVSKTYDISDIYKYDSSTHTISRPSSDSMVFDKIADMGDFKFSAILKATALGSSFNVGLSVKNPSSIVSLVFAGFTSSKGFGRYTNASDIGAFTEINRTGGTLTVNTEYLFEMEINSNNQLIGKITRLSDNTVIYSYTGTAPTGLTGYDVGVFVRNQADITYREIKFQYL